METASPPPPPGLPQFKLGLQHDRPHLPSSVLPTLPGSRVHICCKWCLEGHLTQCGWCHLLNHQVLRWRENSSSQHLRGAVALRVRAVTPRRGFPSLLCCVGSLKQGTKAQFFSLDRQATSRAWLPGLLLNCDKRTSTLYRQPAGQRVARPGHQALGGHRAMGVGQPQSTQHNPGVGSCERASQLKW